MENDALYYIWSAIGGVGGMAIVGFLFLIKRGDTMKLKSDKDIGIIQSELSHRTSFEYVNSEFYKKDVIDAHLKMIENQLNGITKSIDSMTTKLDAVLINNSAKKQE